MSKAVLVIDMPESCDMCNFVEMVNGKMHCGVKGYGPCTEDYIVCRPEWCPLKEMPERMAVHPDDNEYLQGGKNGWNLCINQILGKSGKE